MKKWFILVISILLFSITNVYAKDNSLNLVTTGSFLKNEIITVLFNGNNFHDDLMIKEYRIFMDYDSTYLSKISCTSNLNFSFSDNSQNNSISLSGISLMPSNNTDGNTTFASCQFKILKSGDTSLEVKSNSFVTDESGNVINFLNETYPLNLKEELSNSTSLEGIILSSGVLSPSFSKDIYKYEVSLENVKEIKVTPIKENNNQTVEAITKTLNYGNNLIKLVVKAQDGTTKTYEINVILKDTRSNDTSLEKLYIKGITFNEEFSKDLKVYTADVDYDVTKVYIQAKATNKNAHILVTGATNLTEGKVNIIYVTVTAENGTKDDYIIKLNRMNAPISKDDDLNNNIEGDNSSNLEEDFTNKIPNNNITTDQEESNSITDESAKDLEEENNSLKQIVLIFGLTTLVGLCLVGAYYYIKRPKRNVYDDDED